MFSVSVSSLNFDCVCRLVVKIINVISLLNQHHWDENNLESDVNLIWYSHWNNKPNSNSTLSIKAKSSSHEWNFFESKTKPANLKMKVLHPRSPRVPTIFWQLRRLNHDRVIIHQFKLSISINGHNSTIETEQSKILPIKHKSGKRFCQDEKFSLVHSFDITTVECRSKKWKCR